MFLRELDGFYKGQIREFPSEIGKALIAAGRAENPYAQAPAPTVPVPVAQAPAPTVPAPVAQAPARKTTHRRHL